MQFKNQPQPIDPHKPVMFRNCENHEIIKFLTEMKNEGNRTDTPDSLAFLIRHKDSGRESLHTVWSNGLCVIGQVSQMDLINVPEQQEYYFPVIGVDIECWQENIPSNHLAPFSKAQWECCAYKNGFKLTIQEGKVIAAEVLNKE